MATMTVRELEDALDDPSCVEVKSRPWRHGTRTTYKVEKDGKPYLVDVDHHSEEGMQVYGDTTLRPARKVTTETWVEDYLAEG